MLRLRNLMDAFLRRYVFFGLACVCQTEDAKAQLGVCGGIHGSGWPVTSLHQPLQVGPPGSLRTIVLQNDFCVDFLEITKSDYDKCAAAMRCTPVSADCMKLQDPRAPVACITHDQARAVCAYLGRRLPTEEEWEIAMRGWDFIHTRPKRDFPGRHEMTSIAANQYFRGAAVPHLVGADPDDVAEGHVLDPAGNVAEWTASMFGPDDAIVRGGSFLHPSPQFSIARRHENKNTQVPDIGVRCVYNER